MYLLKEVIEMDVLINYCKRKTILSEDISSAYNYFISMLIKNYHRFTLNLFKFPFTITYEESCSTF